MRGKCGAIKNLKYTMKASNIGGMASEVKIQKRNGSSLHAFKVTRNESAVSGDWTKLTIVSVGKGNGENIIFENCSRISLSAPEKVCWKVMQDEISEE